MHWRSHLVVVAAVAVEIFGFNLELYVQTPFVHEIYEFEYFKYHLLLGIVQFHLLQILFATQRSIMGKNREKDWKSEEK